MTVDLLMTVMLPLQMAYSLIGETYHEAEGVVLFALFISHHAMHRNWCENSGTETAVPDSAPKASEEESGWTPDLDNGDTAADKAVTHFVQKRILTIVLYRLVIAECAFFCDSLDTTPPYFLSYQIRHQPTILYDVLPDMELHLHH